MLKWRSVHSLVQWLKRVAARRPAPAACEEWTYCGTLCDPLQIGLAWPAQSDFTCFTGG